MLKIKFSYNINNLVEIYLLHKFILLQKLCLTNFNLSLIKILKSKTFSIEVIELVIEMCFLV